MGNFRPAISLQVLLADTGFIDCPSMKTRRTVLVLNGVLLLQDKKNPAPQRDTYSCLIYKQCINDPYIYAAHYDAQKSESTSELKGSSVVPGTFNDEGLGQQAEMVCWLVLLGQLLQAHSGTHALGVPVAALHIVHFGHQQQSLVQVPRLEGKRTEPVPPGLVRAGNETRPSKLTRRQPRLRTALRRLLARHSLGCVLSSKGVKPRSRSRFSSRHSSSSASAITSVR